MFFIMWDNKHDDKVTNYTICNIHYKHINKSQLLSHLE